MPFCLYANHQYFTVRLPSHLKDPKSLAKKIACEAVQQHLPLRTSASFGLNEVTIDGFLWHLDNDTPHLRIGASDLPLNYAKEIGLFLTHKIMKYAYVI